MSLFYRHFGMASARMFSEQHAAGNMRKCSSGWSCLALGVYIYCLPDSRTDYWSQGLGNRAKPAE